MARKHYDVDLETINVESWQKLVENHEEIINALDNCCSNVADMIANSTSLKTMTEMMNDQFLTLETVSVSSLYAPDKLVASCKKIHDCLKDKSLVVITSCQYAEQAVKNIAVSSDVTKFFQDVLNGLDDYSFYWIVYEFSKHHGFKALGFVMAYGNDVGEDGGNFVVGDAVKGLFDGIPKIFDVPKYESWVSTAMGTAAVVLFTFAKDIFQNYTDDKKIDADEAKRIIGDVFESGVGFFEWTAIMGAFEAAGVALPGVAVAALASMYTSTYFDIIIDAVTGDYIVHSFEYNNITYEVPANGTGGFTFADMIKSYKKNKDTYHIGDREVSEHEYKEKMYSDTKEFLKEDTGVEVGDSFDIILEALDVLAEADSYDKGLEAFYTFMDEHLGEINYSQFQIGNLVDWYGFDMEEYYYYRNKERGNE